MRISIAEFFVRAWHIGGIPARRLSIQLWASTKNVLKKYIEKKLYLAVLAWWHICIETRCGIQINICSCGANADAYRRRFKNCSYSSQHIEQYIFKLCQLKWRLSSLRSIIILFLVWRIHSDDVISVGFISFGSLFFLLSLFSVQYFFFTFFVRLHECVCRTVFKFVLKYNSKTTQNILKGSCQSLNSLQVDICTKSSKMPKLNLEKYKN